MTAARSTRRPLTWFTLKMDYTDVTPLEFGELDGLDDWRVVLDAIHASFTAPDYLAAADLVRTIAEIAESHVHHPDVELRYPGRVHVALTTHATGGLTTLDIDVARGTTPGIGMGKDGPGVAYLQDGSLRLSELGGLSLRCQILVNAAGLSATGPYRVPNVWIDSKCIYTNLPPGGPYRGFRADRRHA